MKNKTNKQIVWIFLGLLLIVLFSKNALASIEKKQTITKQKKIKIAILDTGVDINHPDLKNKIWKNPGESGFDAWGNAKESNQIDDDKNGFVDDVSGWNFLAQNNRIEDHHGHGTHIAGIIAGRAQIPNDNFQLEANDSIEFIILKYYEPQTRSAQSLSSMAQLILYAVQMQADIINLSGGGAGYDSAEKAAIELAEKRGILLITAAGNEGSNIDQHKYYPASYPLKNILSVGALNQQSHWLQSSNFGPRFVDLMAPGENIKSTWPGGGFQPLSGTSQATAVATYLVSRLLQKNPYLTRQPQLQIDFLIHTGVKMKTVQTLSRSQKMIDFKRALSMSNIFN